MSTINPRLNRAYQHLIQGTFFKPIAGAAVGDVDKIYRWSLIHTAAGASSLDVRWEAACVQAAIRGRTDARARLGDVGDPLVMASVTPEGDVHTMKAALHADKCVPCPICVKACPDDALKLPLDGSPVKLLYDRCRGCNRCVEKCPQDAFDLVAIAEGDLKPRIEEAVAAGADSIELHASGLSAREMDSVLLDLNRQLDDEQILLSVCIGSLKKATGEMLEILEVIRDRRRGRRTMLQADGRTMGSRDGGLLALGLAELVLDARIPNMYVVVSGGVTKSTWEIAELVQLEISGAAMGIESYRVIAAFANDDRILTDDHFLQEAACAARTLQRPAHHKKVHRKSGFRFDGTAVSALGGGKSRRSGSKAIQQAVIKEL